MACSNDSHVVNGLENMCVTISHHDLVITAGRLAADPPAKRLKTEDHFRASGGRFTLFLEKSGAVGMAWQFQWYELSAVSFA